MKLKISIFSLAVAICFSTAMVVCAENETSKKSDKAKAEVKTAESVKKGPVAVAPEPKYEFKSAMDSAEVVHSFVLQNKGDATLLVKKVKTG